MEEPTDKRTKAYKIWKIKMDSIKIEDLPNGGIKVKGNHIDKFIERKQKQA